MTQLPLAPVEPTPARAPRAPLSPLAARVAAWAREHDGAPFWQLCEAMRAGLAEAAWPTPWAVDCAVREAGMWRWVDGKGYEVGREAAEGEML